jgi:hypothetical protein
MKKECSTCYYGRTAPGANAVVCQRYPPTITKVEGNTVTSVFPLMSFSGWCGEFRRAVQSKIRSGP